MEGLDDPQNLAAQPLPSMSDPAQMGPQPAATPVTQPAQAAAPAQKEPASEEPATWEEQAGKLKTAGFSKDEILLEERKQRDLFVSNGFSPAEADKYFGHKTPEAAPTVEPDMSAVKSYISDNLKAFHAPMALPESMSSLPSAPPAIAAKPFFPGGVVEGKNVDPVVEKQQEVAHSFLDYLHVGLGISTSGLTNRNPNDMAKVPEADPSTMMRFAQNAGTLVGDLPAMGAGMITAPLVGLGGAALTAGAAFAMPAGLRKILMDHYEKGDIKDPTEFLDRTMGAFIDAAKGFGTGVASSLVGGKVAEMVAAPLFKTLASTAAEIGTMETVSKALEGHLPSWQGLMDSALLIGGFHGIGVVAPKLRGIYEKTGIRPEEVLAHADADPVVKQEMLASNLDLPTKYKEVIDPAAKPTSIDGVIIPPDSPLTEPLPGLNKDFIPRDGGEIRFGDGEPEKESTLPDREPSDDPALMEAEKHVDSMVSDGKIPAKPIDMKVLAKDIRRGVFNQFLDIKNEVKGFEKSTGKTLGPKENPYMQFVQAKDTASRAVNMMDKGVYNPKTGETIGPAFADVAKEVGKDPRDAIQLAVARRMMEVDVKTEGKSGFDTQKLQKIIDEKSTPENVAFSKGLNDVNNSLLDYAHHSDLISDTNLTKLKEGSESYFPIKRQKANGELQSFSSKGDIIKALKGSNAPIMDPVLATAKRFKTIIEASDKNRAILSLKEFNEAKGTPWELKSEEKADLVNEDGEVTAPVGVDAINPETGEVTVYKNGVKKVYLTTPDEAFAIKQLNGDTVGSNVAIQTLKSFGQKYAQVKRAGIVINPLFAMAHAFRDQTAAAIFSEKSNYVPFLDAIKVIPDMWRKDGPIWDAWEKSGGGAHAFENPGTKEYIEKNLYQLHEDTGYIGTALNAIKNPMEIYHAIERLSGNGLMLTKYAVFKKAFQENPTYEGALAAGFKARGSTIDFQQRGAYEGVKLISSMTAFMPTHLNGIDKLITSFEDRPGRTASAIGIMSAASALLWWGVHDDWEYNQKSESDRAENWFFRINDWNKPTDQKELQDVMKSRPDLVRKVNGEYEINRGVMHSFPKPKEIGPLATVPMESFLNKFVNKNPRAFKEFEESMLKLISTDVLPTAATDAYQAWSGRNMHTNAPIVPDYLVSGPKAEVPALRYTDYTSETAKQLGKFISIAVPGSENSRSNLAAPAAIDFWIKNWTGTPGKLALSLIDKALVGTGIVKDPNAPAPRPQDSPISNVFMTKTPDMSSQWYTNFKEREEMSMRRLNSIQALAKTNNPEGLRAQIYAAQHSNEMVALPEISKAIGALEQAIHQVTINPDPKAYSPADKRKLIDGWTFQMINIAKTGLETMDRLDAQHKSKMDNAAEAATTRGNK